jgi:hypothetical protein
MVEMDNSEPKFVPILGLDPGHHEEFQNGSKNRIYLRYHGVYGLGKFLVVWCCIEVF